MKAKFQIVRLQPRESVDLDRLVRMQPSELQRLHRKMFGCDVPSGNSEQARRRIAWRVQAEREGGLPESARQRALALARDSAAGHHAGMTPSRRHDVLHHATATSLVSDHDPRVPMPGSVIIKDYRGRTILVHVLATGFECDGQRFASLSSIAKEITGTKWNGLVFFGLAKTRANGR